jgi:hypothetical protein
MARGLRAPLSPHEEVTLRRIALGIAKAKLLPARDVAYLVRLGLVDESDGRLSLTALGRQRYEDMPRPAEPLHQDEAQARPKVSPSRSGVVPPYVFRGDLTTCVGSPMRGLFACRVAGAAAFMPTRRRTMDIARSRCLAVQPAGTAIMEIRAVLHSCRSQRRPRYNASACQFEMTRGSIATYLAPLLRQAFLIMGF